MSYTCNLRLKDMTPQYYKYKDFVSQKTLVQIQQRDACGKRAVHVQQTHRACPCPLDPLMKETLHDVEKQVVCELSDKLALTHWTPVAEPCHQSQQPVVEPCHQSQQLSHYQHPAERGDPSCTMHRLRAFTEF